MRVGIVTTWFARGASYVSRAYADALTPRHEVFIFARGGERYARGEDAWDNENVTWAQRSFSDPWVRIDWSEFRDWVRRRRLDLVIFNEQSDWEIVVDARRLGIPILSYVDYYTADTVPFFALFDALLCNTQRHYGVFSWHPQSFYVPWGTDLDVFTPRHARTEPRDEVVFFHSAGMGGINLRKGTDLVVEAFAQVRPGARLLIHSQLPVSEFGQAAERIGSDPRIEFMERTVEPPGLYHLGDVYVYPSRLEGIGLSIVEALACGLPVITTDSPPMNEFVTDGENGRLVPVHEYRGRADGYYWPESICSVAGLRDAMTYYVDERASLPRLAAMARASAEARFDWRKNAADLASMVEACVVDPDRKGIVRQLGPRALEYSRQRRRRKASLLARVRRRLGRR